MSYARVYLHIVGFLGLIIAYPFATSVSASDSENGQYEAEELHRYFKNEADGYEMIYKGEKLKLRSQPLMHWSNPQRNQEQGATYIWTKDQVPLVIVSIFTFEYNNVVRSRHEVISLADDALECRLHDKLVWTPQTSGLEWTSITDTQAPASTPARRLFQMRTIARQFSGVLYSTWRPPNKLALIPQPLTRYQNPKQGLLDGAVFSLAVATDPELLVVIEARMDKGGKPVFRYAPVRSNYNKLELSRNGELVKEFPLVLALESTKAHQKPWSDEPFFVFDPPSPLPEPGTIK